MDRLRRNILFVVLIAGVLVFALTYCFMAVAKNNSTFLLEDLEGDREALRDITISGYLEDRYHGYHFEIKDGTVESNFLYYQQQNDITGLKNYQNLANGINHNDFFYLYNYDFEISRGAKTEERPKENNNAINSPSIRTSAVYTDSIDIYARITKRYADYSVTDDFTTIFFNTGLQYVSSNVDIEFIKQEYIGPAGEIHHTSYHLNRGTFPLALPQMTMTVLNDELYFSIVYTKEYSGRNGIYKAVEFEHWWHDSKYPGTVNTIASFSLDDANIEVLGLEAVNDKLILLLFEDNTLKARLYNTEGQQLDELSFSDITSNKGLPEYQSFINNSCLNIYLKYKTEDLFCENVLLSIQVDESNLRFKHKFKENSSQEMFPFCIASKDDMLYAVALTKDRKMNYLSELPTPDHFMIYAFKTKNDKTHPLYRGKLVTDAAEDYNRNLHTSYGYNLYDYRQFNSVNVR